ncbi:hypothetical protein ACPPVV_04540 [Rhodanobacter sp. Col0626]|uniref:hypothetical protein n=1 Tax=Rhodanobacter sp. Col0626 TaxID=3415679 RepID=UPI003CF4CC6B
MPLPPPDKPAAGHSANPARIMLNSPLAAAMRARVYRQTRPVPRQRRLRVLAAIGTLFVHLMFLLIMALGPAYEPLSPPPPPKEDFLQVRLVEPPEPPPPPPVRGTPPKEHGPRHQGRSSRAAPSREHSANTQSEVAAQPTPAMAKPVIAQAKKARAPAPKPTAAPVPPVSLPKPAPAPELQPVPLAGEPPTVTLPTPVLQPPVPPSFQPEPVRQAQMEGNQPMPPPPSLALPDMPKQSSPPVTVSSIALNTEVPKPTAPASVKLSPAELSAAPPVPELQPIPLPAQPSPSVNLQTQLSAPAPTVTPERPQVQAPAVDVADAELEAVPMAPASPPQAVAAPAAAKIDVAKAAPEIAVQTSIDRPQLSAPAAAEPSPSKADQPTPTPAPTTSSASAANAAASNPGDTNSGQDVSRAPDATPQGSDNATPGEPHGVAAAPENSSRDAGAVRPSAGQGKDTGRNGKQTGSGQPGGDQPGADQGSKQGALGGYVQLKPHGDTQIMGHGTPNIGYKPTRFEQDWTPEGESSIDTALRHAVEKTSVKHTFHLPRGVRVQCTVMPLLPMSLLGCGNADPPPRPVDAKVYERMHLAPAHPLVPPAPAASTTAPAPMIKLDNSAECAAARVAGSPPPPGCEGIVLPVKPANTPASSSSSWVPASDQFH